MNKPMQPTTRKRSPAGAMKERAWLRRLKELSAQETARLPPQPDPIRQTREFVAWMQKHATTGELPPEWKQLHEDMRQLPRLKFRRARDEEVWSWILWLLACQEWGAPYDLRTCSLGANPANELARPSKMLAYLFATVAHRYPDIRRDPYRNIRRLYDAIRNWQKQKRSVSTI